MAVAKRPGVANQFSNGGVGPKSTWKGNQQVSVQIHRAHDQAQLQCSLGKGLSLKAAPKWWGSTSELFYT